MWEGGVKVAARHPPVFCPARTVEGQRNSMPAKIVG
jgi:hypothetical protein